MSTWGACWHLPRVNGSGDRESTRDYIRYHAGSLAVGVLCCLATSLYHRDEDQTKNAAVRLSMIYPTPIPSIDKVDHEVSRFVYTPSIQSFTDRNYRHRSKDKDSFLTTVCTEPNRSAEQVSHSTYPAVNFCTHSSIRTTRLYCVAYQRARLPVTGKFTA